MAPSVRTRRGIPPWPCYVGYENTTSAEGAEVHSDRVSFVDVKGSLVGGNNLFPPPPSAASRRRWGRNVPLPATCEIDGEEVTERNQDLPRSSPGAAQELPSSCPGPVQQMRCPRPMIFKRTLLPFTLKSTRTE